MYKNLILELEAPLAVVTLNRPQCRNALSLDLLQELLDCLGQMEHDRSA